MRFDEYLENLAVELQEIAHLLWLIHDGREFTFCKKNPRQVYKQRRRKVEKLLIRECEGKPGSFSVFNERVKLFFESFDQFSDSPNDGAYWDAKGEISLIVDDLWETYECLDDGTNYAAAAEHIQGFKEEFELLQAGAKALQKEAERKSEYRLDRSNRTLHWFGETYEAIDRNPFEIIEVLYDAFEKGTGWVSLEHLRSECREIATIQGSDLKSIGIAEVFTVRVTDENERKRTRQKLRIWKIIEVDGRKSPCYRLKVPTNQIPE